MADSQTKPRVVPDNVRNIITFMTDQHRIDTLGCMGNTHAQTPNIDSLAADGCLFTKAFTPSAICTPARSSMLTGQLPFKHQTLANPEWNIAYSTAIPETDWTYTQALRDAGYNVGMVGKYHCGTNLPDKFGCDDDTFWGAENPVANEEYVAWLKENDLPPVKAHDIWRGKLPGNRDGHIIAARLEQPEEATFERFIADRSIARLRQYAKEYKETGKPFSLDVHFFGPHLPYFLPDEWFDLMDPKDVMLPKSFGDTLVGKPPVQQNYATYWSTSSFDNDQWRKLIAVYWGYVAMIDFEIGRILDVARELGLMDDTAMFFCADHGEFTGSHRLNDKGPAMYDDLTRRRWRTAAPSSIWRAASRSRIGAGTSYASSTACISRSSSACCAPMITSWSSTTSRWMSSTISGRTRARLTTSMRRRPMTRCAVRWPPSFTASWSSAATAPSPSGWPR